MFWFLSPFIWVAAAALTAVHNGLLFLRARVHRKI